MCVYSYNYTKEGTVWVHAVCEYQCAHAHFWASMCAHVFSQISTWGGKCECRVILCCVQVKSSKFLHHTGYLPDNREEGFLLEPNIHTLDTATVKLFGVCSYVFVTLFSAKWLNCQSPCNYLRGESKGTASKSLMREYWICTSIRVLIKCGLHRDSRATALSQISQCTIGGGTTGRRGGQRMHQGKAARWQRKEQREKSTRCWMMCSLSQVFNQDRSMQMQGQTTGGRSIHVWLRSPSIQVLALDSPRTSENMQPSEAGY